MPKKSKLNSGLSTVAVVGIIVIFAGVIGAAWYFSNHSAPPASQLGVSSGASAPDKTFTVVSRLYSFTPAEITVNKGDKVRIIFQSAEGFHDFVIDEFNARTPRVNTGGSATVDFTADKTGTFQYYCSVANHRQMGMVGKLIVQ